MEITLTEKAPCQISVQCSANAMEIMDKRSQVQNEFKKAPVPGFRKGQATIEVIKIHYRKQIDEALKRALIEDSYHETIFQHKLRAHGAPRINSAVLEGGKFICQFDLFTKPDFELSAYQNMEIPKPPSERTTEEVAQQVLQELREKFGDVVPYVEGDFVQQGDNIIINYEAAIDGEKVENLSKEGEMLSIGKNNIPDFDNNLLGMTLGETREFNIQVPQAALPSLSNKSIHFTVSLVMGSKTNPAPLNDELATKMGRKDFAELQEQVNQAAMARTANDAKTAIQNAVVNRLVAENNINVPDWMSGSEAHYLAHQSQLEWETLSDADKETLIKLAEKNVKLSLVLDRIREIDPEAQLGDQEIFDIIKQNIARSKNTQNKSMDEIIQEMDRTGYLAILFSRIRDEYALDQVVKTVKIVE